MATMVERWMRLADQLLGDFPRSSAMRRRAISTAYYAVFHTVVRLCADEVASEYKRDAPEYEAVYRSFDHGAVRKALGESALAENPGLRAIGESFAQLHDARMNADYKPPIRDIIEQSKAQDLVAEAKRAIANLEALSRADLQLLVIRLLLKDRRR